MHEELIFLVLILMWVCESSDNMEDNFEDTKCVFRGRKSKKNRQYSTHKKKDKQWSTKR
jgi:hypothetical protein